MARAPRSSVTIVIPCYGQTRFLSTAIASAIKQTVPADAIIVVDDGSTDDISTALSAFPGAKLVRRKRGGLAAARNSGLREATSEKIIFLDADDTLLPRAVEAGLQCFSRNPDSAFVYGAFEEIRGTAKTKAFCRVTTHHDLVRCNWIGMIATVMFDRCKLVEIGGFDETLGMTEDWDAYLRLSRRFPFAAHPRLVARYVKHESNMSNDLPELRKWIETVRTREWDRGLDPAGQLAWHQGIDLWRETLDPVQKPRKNLIVRALAKAARLVGAGR